MLASELPFEVIRNIGSFLRLADLLESSLVCRAWKIPFQESLWDVIELHDEDKMDKMSDVSTRVYAFYRKNGYRTRELVICPNIYIDDKEIFILQQHFPNLDCLVIDHSCLGGPGFGSIGDWSLWGSLTELNVDIGGWHHENPAEAFLNISSGLPNLECLVVNHFNGIKPAIITLEQLEGFHSNLPRLKMLVLDMRPAALTEDILSRLGNIEPANRLRSLQLNVFYSLYQWLCYFAIKYPNIQLMVTLQLVDNGELEQYPKEKAFISSLSPPAFQHLRWVDVTTRKNPEQLHLDIWKQFLLLNVELKRITWTLRRDMTDVGHLETIIKKCMNLFSKTLEAFYFLCEFDYRKSWEFTTHIEYFPCLIDLYIKAPHSLIELDVLLDRCCSLKVLKVIDGRLSLGPSENSDPKRHGLRMLICLESIITSDTLDYLSVRCRRLNYMSLTRSVITGEYSADSSCLLIDMSHTHLKILYLNDSRFTISDRDDDRNTDYLVLSRPSRAQTTTDDDEEDNEEDEAMDSWYLVTYEMSGFEACYSNPSCLTKGDVAIVAEILRRQDSGEIKGLDEKQEYIGLNMVPKKWYTENRSLAWVMLKCNMASYDVSPGIDFDHYGWEKIADSFE